MQGCIIIVHGWPTLKFKSISSSPKVRAITIMSFQLFYHNSRYLISSLETRYRASLNSHLSSLSLPLLCFNEKVKITRSLAKAYIS